MCLGRRLCFNKMLTFIHFKDVLSILAKASSVSFLQFFKLSLSIFGMEGMIRSVNIDDVIL